MNQYRQIPQASPTLVQINLPPEIVQVFLQGVREIVREEIAFAAVKAAQNQKHRERINKRN